MKNVFGYDEIEETWDGGKFIVRKACAEGDANRAQWEEIETALKKAVRSSSWIFFVGMLVFTVGFFLVGAFAKAAVAKGFAATMNRGGWIFIVGLILTALGVGIFVFSFWRQNRASKSPLYRNLKEKELQIARACYAALGVPLDAKEIDVIKSCSWDNYNECKASAFNEFYAVMAYRERDALNFACTDCVFSIPLSRIERIQCINKRVWAYGWNKTEPWSGGAFGAYGIKKKFGSYEKYSTQFYYKLVCRDENGEEYCVIVPSYDAETVLALTGKTVE